MSSNDKGKDFLFSDDCGFTNGNDGESYRYSDGSGYYHGKDGSEGYIYSDGSGYYHGADGSEGHIYSDGSAYYRGADGSDGYKYSDGSGYYHGADGSDGYKYSDGSGYYNGKDASSDTLDSMENSFDYCSNSSNSAKYTAGLLGIGLGVGTVLGIGKAFSKITDKIATGIEEVQREERERKRKREELIFKILSKIWPFMLLLFLMVIFFITRAIWIEENKKLISVGYSSLELVGQDHEVVKAKLFGVGFENINVLAMNDLSYLEREQEGTVDTVLIGKNSFFEADTKFKCYEDILISYHSVKLVKIPFNTRDIKGDNYEDVANRLSDAGFVNIKLEPIYDILTGWITDDGEIEELLIEGVENVKIDTEYYPDVEIVIKYHTYKKKQPK